MLSGRKSSEHRASSSSRSHKSAAHVERLAAALPKRYVFHRELGEGGAAYVLLAEDRERQELVAVKILRPEVTTSVGEQRFLREIEIIQGLKHPNILPL